MDGHESHGTSADTSAAWYAAQTRSRHEKIVARQFTERRVEHFLPLRAEVHKWKDRYKKVEVPLFYGYIFVQLPLEPVQRTRVRLTVLKTPGIVRIVGFAHEDTPIPMEQIEALRRVMEAGIATDKHKFLKVGQRVKILSGVLAGVEGILTRVKKAERLVISVEPIRQGVAIELAGYEVTPIG